MRRVYICSPLGGNVSANIENAKRYARYALECGMAPFIPHFYALILDDSNKEERNLGMLAGLSLLWVCDEVWAFGDEITEGMKKEILFAEKLNIKVRYISENDLRKSEVQMIESRKIKLLKWIAGISVILIMLGISAVTVFAAGDVSSAIQNTWNSAQTQIKNVVNNVVFPAVDMILAILFFVKLATAYMDYRKHGQFEFTAPAILFGCLVFSLTAPLYIWTIL